MKGLSLFSGSGIGELAFKHIIPNYRTIGYVEIDKYCRSIIRARIRDGVLDDAPIFDDIRTFNERYARRYIGKVDLISGGFPCQPFSVAGKQKGEHDERNLWPDTLRSISIIRPKFALLENVPNILTHKYVMRIFGDLVEIGYDCEWDVVSAAFCGAPHLRKRVWIIAHSNGGGGDDGILCKRRKEGDEQRKTRIWGTDWQKSEVGTRPVAILQNWVKISMGQSPLMRMDDGIPFELGELKACGNGWVPQVVERILQIDTEDTI